MSVILHIESATEGCSVAVSDEGQLVFNKEDHRSHNNAVSLGVLVDEALALVDSRGLKLDAVAVSEGPGSYTGLRIGVSMAKGVCYGRGLELLSVSTLKLLCVRPLLTMELPDDALLCPMIDARRMEVYSAVYSLADSRQPVRTTEIVPTVVDSNSFSDLLETGPVLFIGDGAAKCADVISSANATFVQVCPDATAMLEPALRAWNEKRFENTAYFEPFYLKEFVATVSHKNLF